MDQHEENVRIVERFLECLKAKDFTGAPISSDIYFLEPLMGEGRGAAALKAFVAGFFPALTDVRIIEHICQGDRVATRWEVDGVFGIIPIFELFRIRDGEIVEFRAFYDPRPIIG